MSSQVTVKTSMSELSDRLYSSVQKCTDAHPNPMQGKETIAAA